MGTETPVTTTSEHIANLNNIEIDIGDVITKLMSQSATTENGRVKSMIKTKLQEAQLLASKLYDSSF